MLFKVFYQETKLRSPKRETTKSLYVELDNVDEEVDIDVEDDEDDSYDTDED